jgi:hypothetical protein
LLGSVVDYSLPRFFGVETGLMCPECFVTVALLATGIVSTAGVAALAARLFADQKPLEKVSEARIPPAEENLK